MTERPFFSTHRLALIIPVLAGLVIVAAFAASASTQRVVEAARLTPGGQVEVSYVSGGCDRWPGLRVRESAQRVTITVRVWVFDAVCDGAALERSLLAELDQPLGDRTLVDGETGREVPVSGRSLST